MPDYITRKECGDPIASGAHALQEPDQTSQEILTIWMTHFNVRCTSQIKDSHQFLAMTKHLPGAFIGYKIHRDYFYVFTADTLYWFYYKEPSVCVGIGTIFPC
jgi:hypothetical protein